MNFSEDRLMVSSIKKCRDLLPIPTDLVIEIFSRLPAKSVKRFSFLSKFWFKVIQSQYFIDLFAAKSSARPQILFLEENVSDILFLSAHQSSENSSHIIAPTHFAHCPRSISRLFLSCYNHLNYGVPINGLVCVTGYLEGRYLSNILNPSTGECLTLPEMKTESACPDMRNLLGYDPIEKQFKVLSVVYEASQWVPGHINNVVVEYQVLTLETEKLSWRMIKCCTLPHCPRYHHGICINGVLYYHATGLLNGLLTELIVCFDVKFETFKFMKVMETFNEEVSERMLTNCDGKLALLIPEKSNKFISVLIKNFELWILKDAEKHEWSKYVYVVPPNWKEVVGKNILSCIGMIGSNEIVLSCLYHEFGIVHKRPYIFYFNIEKNSIRRIDIDIQGMKKEASECKVYMYLNYVEGVSLFKLLK